VPRVNVAAAGSGCAARLPDFLGRTPFLDGKLFLNRNFGGKVRPPARGRAEGRHKHTLALKSSRRASSLGLPRLLAVLRAGP